MVRLIDNFKEQFDFLLRPLIKPLVAFKVKPFYMSTLSFILGIISVFFLYSNHNLFLLFILLHLLFDKLDGTLARLTNHITNFGKWADYILDSFILFSLLLKSYIIFPSTAASIFFTKFFVLITLITYLALGIIQIFVKKRNTFGAHFTGLILFMFKKYEYAIIGVFLISLYGAIYHIFKRDRHERI